MAGPADTQAMGALHQPQELRKTRRREVSGPVRHEQVAKVGQERRPGVAPVGGIASLGVQRERSPTRPFRPVAAEVIGDVE